MTLLADVQTGCQVPRYHSSPKVSRSAAEEAIELAADAGLILDPAQQLVFYDALGVRDDDKWASFEVAVVEPRQNGKGVLIEARELAGLYLFGEELLMHSAHEFKTAYEGFRRITSLIEDNPELSRKIKIIRTGAGDQSIELKTGQRLRFVARSRHSGRGFSGDVVFLDEAYNLSSETMAALLPTLSARPNPQLWYTSSAPLPLEGSDVLRRVCKRGRNGSTERMAYFEWCADRDAALDDPAAWAQANPALGLRIDPEFVRAELEVLGPDEFARERLGIWSEDDQNARVMPVEVWAACFDEGSGLTGPLSYALDVSPDRVWSSIVVAAESDRGDAVHVELVDRRRGTGWLTERAVELQQKWGGKFAVAKGSPAWSLKEDLEAARVDLLPISTEEHSQACGDLYDAVIEHRLRHIGQDELDAAVAGADRRFYGDAWLWSRKTSSVDISPLVAVTLAHWVAQKRQRKPKIW
jgi:hypothetical protein